MADLIAYHGYRAAGGIPAPGCPAHAARMLNKHIRLAGPTRQVTVGLPAADLSCSCRPTLVRKATR